MQGRRRHCGRENVLECTRFLSLIPGPCLMLASSPTAGAYPWLRRRTAGCVPPPLRSSSRPSARLRTLEQFFDLRDHSTGFIFHLDHEDRLVPGERLQLLANIPNLCVGQTKFGSDSSAARLLV